MVEKSTKQQMTQESCGRGEEDANPTAHTQMLEQKAAETSSMAVPG